MTQPQLQELLEAGVHFGHQTRRWNPKMRRFIFAERSGIYLIDLQKTLRQLQKAQELLREVVMRGDNVLFVCTKRQLNEIVRAEAERCGAFWVVERWLGGTLTNFQTIKKQIQRLKELEQGQEEGTFEFFTKKEQLQSEQAGYPGRRDCGHERQSRPDLGADSGERRCHSLGVADYERARRCCDGSPEPSPCSRNDVGCGGVLHLQYGHGAG